MIIKLLKISRAIIFFILLITFAYIPLYIFNIDINTFSYNQKIVYQFACDAIFLLLIILAYKNTLINDGKKFFKNFAKNFETSFKYWFAGFLIMVISNYFIAYLLDGELSQNEESIRQLLKSAKYYMIFSISIYAPITEELIFRKGLRDIIERKWLYIITSGFIFGFLHVISSLTTPITLLYLIPYCALGIAFAMCYYKTNNIWSTISIHCMHNSLTLVLYFISGVF